MFEQKLKNIMGQIETALKNAGPDNSLPGNAFYLENGDVLCCQRNSGVHRFPYQDGGFTMWAFSNGVIFAVEGVLNVFRPIHLEHDSSVNFFACVKQDDGTYFPISILGGGKQVFEPYNVKRYLVYSNTAAYYIADCDIATFCIRASVTANKQMCFSFCAINKTDKPLEYTLNTYFEALLKNGEHDSMWEKGSRISQYLGEGRFLLGRNSDDYHTMLIERKVEGGKVGKTYHTAIRPDYLGCQTCSIGNAESLKYGKFEKETDMGSSYTPVAAEIIHFETEDTTRVDFLLTVSNSREEQPFNEISGAEIDTILENKAKYEKNRFANTTLEFSDWHNDKISANVLNNFLKNLQKQVDFCSMGENYVEHLLGVRDVYQQLEQAIIWSPDLAREKVVRPLNFIDPSGRAPRQLSFPQFEGQIPAMDLRAFIDQGNWILTTFYMYLAYTGDFSVLDEECGYFEIVDDTKNLVKYTDLRDSVLDHLLRICDYLVSNIDPDTNCLKIVHGDWNDAVDGLGKTTDEGKRYGNGVSVMASLQLYRNLDETAQILEKLGRYEKAKEYLAVREKLAEGLKKHAIETNEKGEKRLVHGWGDKQAYKVGSFCDSDGVSRISFAPFSYWAISGLISDTPELRDLIVDTLHSLDSKYGLLTLYPAFTPDTPGVGRIAYTEEGFAENACAYVHASMFSTMALFLLGDSEFAWKQIEKSIIITHDNADKTTFVMPNSYCRNESVCIDGYSQNDWFTGSGTVLYKNFYRFGFGIEPDLDGLTIQTAAYMPCDEAKAEFLMKGKRIKLVYKKAGLGERKIFVNGVDADAKFDPMMRTKKIYIPNEIITEGMVIEVVD